MAMNLTEEDVYRVEHKLIRDTDVWGDFENDKLNVALLTYISGINDMANEIIKCLKDLGER